MRGRTQTTWWGVVLEAPDAQALARFYSQVLGWPVVTEELGWAVIKAEESVTYISFNSSPNYVAPVWPCVEGSQQMMMHIDVAVDDLDAALAHAIELGATLATYQPQDTTRVMLDPAGHPFCLYLDA